VTKGGSRIGAGRKSKPPNEKKASLLVSLDPHVARWLQQQPRYSNLVNSLLSIQMSQLTTRETTTASQNFKQVRIAILSNSGGAGKSTLCHNIAYNLNKLGKSTLLLDLDIQHNLDLFCGLTSTKKVGTMVDVFAEDFQGNYPIVQIEGRQTSIIRGSNELQRVQQELVLRRRREQVLADLFVDYPLKNDVILMDCPATLGLVIDNAIASATHLLIPLVPEGKAVQGLNGLFDTIEKITRDLRLNPRPSVLGIVPVGYEKDTASHRQALAAFKSRCDYIGVELFEPITDSKEVKNANEAGKPIGIYRPGHRSSLEFERLTKLLFDKIYGKIQPNDSAR
jgi:chromosome partitioning protein